MRRQRLRPNQPPVQLVQGVFSARIEQLEREGDHRYPSSASHCLSQRSEAQFYLLVTVFSQINPVRAILCTVHFNITLMSAQRLHCRRLYVLAACYNRDVRTRHAVDPSC